VAQRELRTTRASRRTGSCQRAVRQFGIWTRRPPRDLSSASRAAPVDSVRRGLGHPARGRPTLRPLDTPWRRRRACSARSTRRPRSRPVSAASTRNVSSTLRQFGEPSCRATQPSVIAPRQRNESESRDEALDPPAHRRRERMLPPVRCRARSRRTGGGRRARAGRCCRNAPSSGSKDCGLPATRVVERRARRG